MGTHSDKVYLRYLYFRVKTVPQTLVCPERAAELIKFLDLNLPGILHDQTIAFDDTVQLDKVPSRKGPDITLMLEVTRSSALTGNFWQGFTATYFSIPITEVGESVDSDSCGESVDSESCICEFDLDDDDESRSETQLHAQPSSLLPISYNATKELFHC
jgi:hypothetical protein